jgi:hypothetical protein
MVRCRVSLWVPEPTGSISVTAPWTVYWGGLLTAVGLGAALLLAILRRRVTSPNPALKASQAGGN